jgi:hypothetical protein
MEYGAHTRGLAMNAPAAPRARAGWTTRHPQLTGALLLVALHAFFVLTGGFIASVYAPLKPEATYLLLGLVQLFYVIPVTLLALKLHRPQVATGIVKAALVTFVLNLGACAFMGYQLSRIV